MASPQRPGTVSTLPTSSGMDRPRSDPGRSGILRWRLLSVAALLLAAACRMPRPTSPLDRAAMADDAVAVRALVAGGADPNAFDDAGWTPLIWAARTGRLEATRALLSAGAQPDRRDAYVNGWTAMMHAVHKGRKGAIRELLDAGADPNARSRNGTTALMLAASERDGEIVRLLLDAGADPRARTDSGGSALFDAVVSGEAANAELLLERDAALHLAPGPWTEGALLLARLRGQGELARRIAPIR